MLFDLKNFNGEVFEKYVDNVPNLNRNELLKSGAVVQAQQYASLLSDQVGGHYISTPIKAKIGGIPDNYDGMTDIKADSRGTYTQGRIVIGRMHGWTEKDFSSDITGEDFMPAVTEIAEYWDKVDQGLILSSLKGIFSMTGEGNDEFIEKHTYEQGMFNETTVNNAIQQAAGDNKTQFSLVIMHSVIATNLENLNLLKYLKYTDSNGVQRNLRLATLNGLLVLIDDTVPVERVSAKYIKSAEGVAKALRVVESAPDDGEVAKADVIGDIADVEEGDFVEYLKAGNEYTTYVFANGAIEYTNVGAKVPYEMARDAATAGGVDTLYSRMRKIFAFNGISFTNSDIISPSDEELEDGSNWSLASSNQKESPKFYPEKAIGIAQIKTRG